ncbi:MAG: arginine--tRNA ligase, partial [Kiloniellales bacterium]
MNPFKDLKSLVVGELEALADEGALPRGLDYTRVAAEPPREAAHGDVATNAAMVLSKPAGKKPRELAKVLVPRLQALEQVTAVEVAGPGFINMRLDPAFWQTCLAGILRAGDDYGSSELGAGRKVNVEYVSTNPTGPLHVGHARGAVVGDALAALFEKVGYDVTREYYINDAGAQVEKLAYAAYWRYLDALGDTISKKVVEDFLADTDLEYRGDYLVPVGEALAKKFGTKFVDIPSDEWLPIVRDYTIDALMDLIRADLAALGIHQEVFASERALVEAGAIEEVLQSLEARGLIYTGVLEPPKGKKPDDWEPRPQTLFRATDFGDDVDRPLKKSDGNWTYFATDMAYHLDKYRRGADAMINVWGADHGGYVKRMEAAVNALTEGKCGLKVLICQLVMLLRAGKPVKMSKRAGTFLTLREVIDEVGKDVVRFIMLTRKN